jgi:hypothetical protein
MGLISLAVPSRPRAREMNASFRREESSEKGGKWTGGMAARFIDIDCSGVNAYRYRLGLIPT